MKKSWDLAGKLNIIKVQRVENPVSYCDYKRHSKSLLELATITDGIRPVTAYNNEAEVYTATLGLTELDQMCVREINEYLLFHGTDESSCNAIVAQGLDMRLAHDGLFGKGVYLAEMASKSHQYTGKTQKPKIQFCLSFVNFKQMLS